MASRGSEPGERRGGRKAGVPNKSTAVLKDVAAAFTVEAVAILADIARSPKSPAAARVAACRELLDRGHGRAPQSFTADMPQLAAVAAALERKVIHELHPGPTQDKP